MEGEAEEEIVSGFRHSRAETGRLQREKLKKNHDTGLGVGPGHGQ